MMVIDCKMIVSTSTDRDDVSIPVGAILLYYWFIGLLIVLKWRGQNRMNEREDLKHDCCYQFKNMNAAR